ncbi:isocitrate lyase/phosphoenolpyruvate mutase family protein [Streptomyces sp. JJ36]|uniref:isocitrate lyase/PEP mutase family protein n=1 Tax=Streptomyces sp. JJ36 TaxID=2736645 RepID=UPI001F4892EA|nr:isocitrate lyase/phosphoenolpyruvate mutase family protein [Streptomyces sp. JJ36]MCF6522421.1 isocitrate lyase/phosphoenolpyruvate mutase family protein [Streptomyces sp. JJ36]
MTGTTGATGRRFEELHRQDGAFVLANAWDAGTARLLAELGFAALGTTSAGLAHALGRPDGANAVGRDETLANAAAIAAATELPVSADLESGFGATPGEVAETIRLAAAAGLAGGSVEDATGRPGEPVRPLEEAAERVAAAAGAARSLPQPFVLTARAENFLHGRPDLEDTVRRLQAYEAAGADVLFAPGLPDAEAIRTVVGAVNRPVNVLMGGSGPRLSTAELAALGVRRISVGSALARTATAAVRDAAREILTEGTFGFARSAPTVRDVNAVMGQDRTA